MFERYTENARRIIFFARYEASQFGSPYIETEHLLLGLLREDKTLTRRFLRGKEAPESIRKQIEDVTIRRDKTSTAVDTPLSNESKRVLIYAAEEAERLSDKHIGPEHLLLGLLREENSLAAQLLHERGLRLSMVREELAVKAREANEPAPQAKDRGILADFTRHLSQMAHEERLLPLIGRDKEMQQIMHVLGRSSKNNAALVGETGVGKRTIVEGLVQRAADSVAPEYFENKIFISVDLAMLVTAARHSAKPKEFMSAVTAEMIRSGANTIFVFDELHMLLSDPSAGAHEITLLLKPALVGGKIRCIATATPDDYRAALHKARWLDRCFLSVEAQPATEDEAILVLQGIKNRFEKFHSVRYSEEALRAAVFYSNRCVKNRCLPEKAVDLIDDAGAYVKMNYETVVLPQEVIEARKRLKFIARRHNDAVANHEFEKARFYSDEEHKNREKLLELQKKHKIEHEPAAMVTEEHVMEALARWTGMSPEGIREMAADFGVKGGKAHQPARRRKQTKKKSS